MQVLTLLNYNCFQYKAHLEVQRRHLNTNYKLQSQLGPTILTIVNYSECFKIDK